MKIEVKTMKVLSALLGIIDENGGKKKGKSNRKGRGVY